LFGGLSLNSNTKTTKSIELQLSKYRMMTKWNMRQKRVSDCKKKLWRWCSSSRACLRIMTMTMVTILPKNNSLDIVKSHVLCVSSMACILFCSIKISKNIVTFHLFFSFIYFSTFWVWVSCTLLAFCLALPTIILNFFSSF
jgi:hypothetical protein